MSAALETLLIKSANIRLMANAVIGRVSVPIGEYCSARVLGSHREKPRNSALKPKPQLVSGPSVFPNQAYDIADERSNPFRSR
jgi:hypothetical protein